MQELTLQEVQDILVGCTILGTGGGGSLDEGLKAVGEAYAKGKTVKLLPFDAVDEDAWYVNPYYCGSVKPDEAETDAPVPEKNELMLAVEALEEYLKVHFDGFISIEYGGGNTGTAMAASACMDRFMVDCDAAGRAVPELQFSTYFVTGKPIAPMSVATRFGDAAILMRVGDDARAEALSRFMAVASDDTVGIADHPIRGGDLKTSVIPGALTYAGRVGKAQREAAVHGENAVERILAAAGDGKRLFTGRVVENGTGWKLQDGFTLGTVQLENESDTFRFWYKNENMVCWKNGKPYMTCPDLICVVDAKTGYPVTNPNCAPGMELAVLAFPAHALWKTEKGRSILNPRFFGFDLDPIGIESV